MTRPIRMLLVGTPAGEFRQAAGLAQGVGAEVAMADTPADALARLREAGADLVMIDVDTDVPGFLGQLRAERFAVPVLACGIHAPAERAVAAIRAGARDYVPLPPERELIAAAIASVIEHRAPALIGAHPAFARASALALAVAPSGAAVLLHGERGTGKLAMARGIHEASGRPDPMLVVDCAGVSPEILESELFGHEAGAFAGAVARRLGALEKAGEGTILLREIAALPASLQARLLGLLKDQVFTRVGGNERLPFAARLLATTAAELEERVENGQFRADLLARIGLVRVELPTLRARGDDIALLAGHFAARGAEGLAPRPLADETLVLLRRYGWPGNIGELEAAIHRAVLIARGPRILPEDVILGDGSCIADLESAGDPQRIEIDGLVGRTVEEVERELILQTLERCHGNRTSASHILGISVRTMRNKLRTFIEAGIAVSPAI